MTISAVIPTYRREALLREAVLSVLSQDVPDAEIEVVVVNDAGEPLAHADWQDDPRVLVANTYQTERSVARNTGAALSRGEYLHFLDDDDVALPGAYAALLEAAERSGAGFTFGSYHAAMGDGCDVRVVRPVAVGHAFAVLLAGLGIPLGAGLLRRSAFLEAGGFDLSFTVMEDMELLQRVSMLGEFIGIEAVVARFRMGDHALSTTARSTGSEACRRQREKAFCHPKCSAYLAESLREHRSAALRGFLARYCFGSAARNARDGRLLAAISRLGTGCALAWKGTLRSRFWMAACGWEKAVVPGLDEPG